MLVALAVEPEDGRFVCRVLDVGDPQRRPQPVYRVDDIVVLDVSSVRVHRFVELSDSRDDVELLGE